MAITVAGEGWIGDLYEWFGAPQWVQVYDRRSNASLPVPALPSGGTQPIRADTAPIQIPTVVPRRTPDFTNATPPPLIGVGLPDIPSGPLHEEGTETMALEDWIQTARDVANVWGQQQVGWGGAQTFVSAGSVQTQAATPPASVAATGLPKGMYVDSHGHLVHRRRRRRPCITQTDLSLAWQISNLPNNANVKMFLAKCVK